MDNASRTLRHPSVSVSLHRASPFPSDRQRVPEGHVSNCSSYISQSAISYFVSPALYASPSRCSFLRSSLPMACSLHERASMCDKGLFSGGIRTFGLSFKAGNSRILFNVKDDDVQVCSFALPTTNIRLVDDGRVLYLHRVANAAAMPATHRPLSTWPMLHRPNTTRSGAMGETRHSRDPEFRRPL